MNPYRFKFDIKEIGAGSRYVVQFPDLPGFIVDGDDVAETVERAHDLARVWLKDAAWRGRVPLPTKRNLYQ